MKIFLKKHIDAFEYYQQHLGLSMTKVGEIYNINRHALAKDYSPYYDAAKIFEKDDSYWCFDTNEAAAIDEYLHDPTTPIATISKTHHIVAKTLVYWIDKLGLNKRNPNFRKYQCNEHIFDVIDTEEKAYWLGFLLADGYNNQERGFIKLSLGDCDYDHLVKFNNFLGSNAPIKSDVGGSGNRTWSLWINRRYLSTILAKYNIIQNKSGKEKFSELIPSELYCHYIRGLIDGDGSVSDGDQPMISLVGSKSLLTRVLNIFATITPLNTNQHISQHGVIWKLRLNAQKNVLDLYQYLYQNATIFLDRKYNKAIRNMAVLKSRIKTGTVE